MMFKRAADQRRSRLQYRPTAGGVDKLGLRVAALLQRRLGADAALELSALPLQPVTLRVALFFLEAEFFVPALEFERLAAAASGSSAFISSTRRASSTPSARSARRSRCWRSASATRARSPSRASKGVTSEPGGREAALVAIVSLALPWRARASSSALRAISLRSAAARRFVSAVRASTRRSFRSRAAASAGRSARAGAQRWTSARASVSKSLMFRWIPATRRMRLRWFSASLKALSQTSRAVSAASIEASPSRPRAPTATAQRPANRRGGPRRPRLRFSLPRRRRRASMNRVSRSRDLSQARVNLVQTPLEAIGQPDAIEALDRRSIRPRRQGRAEPARCGGARLLSPRARSGARRVCRASSETVRRGETIPASWQASAGWRRPASKACAQPCSVSASSPAARASAACGESVLAGLFVEPLGFERVFGQPRGVFDRIVRQKIRVDAEALELGDVIAERGLSGASARRISPPATAATPSRGASAPRRCDPPSPEGGRLRAGRGGRSFPRSPSRPPLALLRLRAPRARPLRTRRQNEARSSGRGNGILASASRSTTGGSSLAAASASSQSVLRQRGPAVCGPPRLLGDLAEGGIFLAQRRGIEVSALRLSRIARGLAGLLRLGELSGLRVRRCFPVAPLLDQFARLGLRGFRRPPCFKRTDIGQT